MKERGRDRFLSELLDLAARPKFKFPGLFCCLTVTLSHWPFFLFLPLLSEIPAERTDILRQNISHRRKHLITHSTYQWELGFRLCCGLFFHGHYLKSFLASVAFTNVNLCCFLIPLLMVGISDLHSVVVISDQGVLNVT